METDRDGGGQPDQMCTGMTVVIAIAGIIEAVTAPVRSGSVGIVSGKGEPLPGEGPTARETEHGENQ
jgi:hypothetical protein